MLDEEYWSQRLPLTLRTWVMPPRISQLVRKEQLESMHNLVFKLGGDLLELGCGAGWLSIRFAQAGMNVLGVDISEASLIKARRNAVEAKTENVDFQYLDLRRFDPGKLNRKFDSIISFAVLYWLQDDIENILPKLAGLLKENGVLYLCEPLKYPYHSKTATRLLNIYALPIILLRRFIYGTGFLMDPQVRELLKSPVAAQPPHANAFNPAKLEPMLAQHFVIKQVDYWQSRSQALAELCAALRKNVQVFCIPLVPLVYKLERRLLNSKSFREKSNIGILGSYCCSKQSNGLEIA